MKNYIDILGEVLSEIFFILFSISGLFRIRENSKLKQNNKKSFSLLI